MTSLLPKLKELEYVYLSTNSPQDKALSETSRKGLDSTSKSNTRIEVERS